MTQPVTQPLAHPSTGTRIEASRVVAASAPEIFALLCDPQGHVAIDATGMLQDADGEMVTAAGDTFVVHMDREALGDLPEMGRYDVTITIEDHEQDVEISWSLVGPRGYSIGHRFGYRLEAAGDDATTVTSYCDWSRALPDWVSVFPVVSEAALKGTLGILDRTVRRGYPRG